MFYYFIDLISGEAIWSGSKCRVVFTKDRQATIIIQFYTRPAGGAVSAAGRTLFVDVKMILNNLLMEQID